RPSEAAEHGTSRKLWPLVTATLLAVAAMAMITVNNQALISVVGAAIVAVAFLIFVVYQVVAARTVKQILLSLPCLLLAGALAYGVSLGTGQAVQSMLNVTPKPDEIASVTFRGHDYKLGTPEYVTLLLNRISYTDDEMKKYISSSLSDAVDRVNDPRNAAYDEYSQYQMIEPITLKLTNGQTVDRTILFKNIDTLNELREKDSAYQTAIRSFPDQANMQYLYVNRNFTDAECQAIWDSLKTEAKALNLVTNDYYRKQSETDTLDPSGYSYQRGNAQVLISLSYGGYVGDRRFVDYNTSVRMETPKTAALLMKTYNKYMKPDTIARMREAIKHISSPLALENDSVNISLTFFNVPRTGGEPAQIPINLYLSVYNKRNDSSSATYMDYADRFADIVKRGTPTDDPNGMFVWLSWNDYDSSNPSSEQEPDCFLSFSDADQQALISLIDEMQTANLY
ncbi:MAG TPA: hypothetical protein PLP25_02985, partial [Candidatus Limiplasma sp.]|nr:hypothetical protein [Candidatus Limiplasma sp.]